MSYRLVIGNKNYSSWSLRAWLYLRESGVDFEEIRVPLFEGDWQRELARHTPAGRVPVLLDGDPSAQDGASDEASDRVWDTMAIYEYVQERHADAVPWPEDPTERALARSLAAEMHAGFPALRDELPQNLRRHFRLPLSELSPAARADVARIEQMWSVLRATHAERGVRSATCAHQADSR